MRLLLADPEPFVLEGLQRLLFDLEPTWEVVSTRTTQEALAALDQRPCDVVVTELRGESLDGVALLSRIAQEHPRSARFVLSSHADEAAALGLMQVAHQLLPKPCAAETLHHVLTRLQQLASLLPDRKLQTLAAQAGSLPSPPHILENVRAALESEADSAALGALVHADPGLTAKLMQLGASGLVCGFGKIADLQAAHQQLSAPIMRRLTRSLSIPPSAPPSGAPSITALRASQERARRIARLAARLSRLPEDAATAYAAGLLCDVGQLLLARSAPERLYGTQAEASQRGVPAHVVEQAHWGSTHAELGAYLLGLWGLPFQVVEAVANHHAPERAAADRLGLTQLVWLAACVVDGEIPSPDLLALFGAEELYLDAQRTLRQQTAA